MKWVFLNSLRIRKFKTIGVLFPFDRFCFGIVSAIFG